MFMSYKMVSLCERRSDPRFNIPPSNLSPIDEEVFVQVENVVDGVLVVSTEKKVVNPRDAFKQWKVSDFKLQNIIASGSVALLKPMSFGSSDVDSALNNIDTLLDTLDSAQTNTND